MSVWRSETLCAKLPTLIQPFSADRIKHAAYELSLGSEYFLTSESTGTKTLIKPGDQIAIPPGQFALLITEEIVEVPADALGLISIRFKYKEPGLINISGFHVDPGFRGRLKFSVYNAGPTPIHLTSGCPVFLLWFLGLDQQTSDVYLGDRKNQASLSDRDTMMLAGQVTSPASLKSDIEKLRSEVSHLKWIGTAVFAVLLGVLVRSCPSIDRPNAPPNPHGGTANQATQPARPETPPPVKNQSSARESIRPPRSKSDPNRSGDPETQPSLPR